MKFRRLILNDLQESLSSLAPYWDSPGTFGDVISCYGESISYLEMFCRSAYGVAAYTTEYGDNPFIRAFCRRYLTVIRDPRYSTLKDFDQKAVEMVPVAVLFLLQRKYTWDTFSVEEKTLVADYFAQIAKIRLYPCNWVLFRILVRAFLRLAARETGDEREDWKFIDKCYDGDGWYRDGTDGCKDYYNAFGFHFYSLVYLLACGEEDPERAGVIRRRAELFARGYARLFDAGGRMIPFGRSMIYRFAALSFWSLYLAAGLGTEGERREVCSLTQRNYNWWREQQIFSGNGQYNLGYAYPNTLICEEYNSSGSPFWAYKFFLILLMKDDDPAWTGDAGPGTERFGISTIAGHDITVLEDGFLNIAFPNGFKGSTHRQNHAKYMHFAYNSATGFNLSRDGAVSEDSSLVFSYNGKKGVRIHNDAFLQLDGGVQLFSWHSGTRFAVKSLVIPAGSGYYRFHLVYSATNCVCYETGFPIPGTEGDTRTGKDAIWLGATQYFSSMQLLEGGEPLQLVNEPDTNICFRHTRVPAIRYAIKAGLIFLGDYTSLTQQASSGHPGRYEQGILLLDGNRIDVRDLLARLTFYKRWRVILRSVFHSIPRRR